MAKRPPHKIQGKINKIFDETINFIGFLCFLATPFAVSYSLCVFLEDVSKFLNQLNF